jgi:cell division septation protein DedD
MKNQHGGILTKLFIIPIGVAFMVGFFFLGYYVGKYQQGKPVTQAEDVSPLPDIVAKNLPSKEEFTFYKTLTDKNDKTVSIDLKPKPAQQENKPEIKQPAPEEKKAKEVTPPAKEKQLEIKIHKEEAPTKQQKQTASKQQVVAKKEPVPKATSSTKIRYTLQLASYPEKEPAEVDVKRLKQRGYAAFIVAAEVPGKGTWYRVRLGSLPSKPAAEKLQKEVNTKEGLSPIIVME